MSGLYKVLGLMSGTSLDGLDLAFCQFEKIDESWHFQIIDTETVEYPENIREQLIKATSLTGEQLVQLDLELGNLYGQLASDFIDQYNISVDFIASHGHTVFHQPERKITFQIGNGIAMAVATKLPVINDFRSSDVLLGGQGAPLVPMGDRYLFSDYSACINLGGIANISFEENGERIAYDVCPANMPLNMLSTKLGLLFDDEGKLAASGNLDSALFKKLETLAYYNERGPKSLGFEWVEKNIISEFQTNSRSEIDLLCTLVEHTASRIAHELKLHDIHGKVLLTGGGALNTYLVKRMKGLAPKNVVFEIPDKDLIVYKEAMIFAFLGVLRWRKEINILASVTGASRDHSSGTIIFFDGSRQQ